MQWFGKAVQFVRFLGQVDQDDPTNLPVGCASVCRNVEFARDQGNVTSATTRAGINLGIQGKNQAAITGHEEFVYQPEFAGDTAAFERPVFFDAAGTLQYEAPLGTGRAVAFPATPGGFTPPVGTHMLGCSAFNKVWAAFSNLKQASTTPACIDPKALTVYPLGMKPVGWVWQPNTPVLANEICTPAVAGGNGHTYQAQNNGTTAAAAPAFTASDPDGTEYIDNPGPNQVVWKELTMVIANRLWTPSSPTLSLNTGGGIAAGMDVYVVITLNNTAGETLPSTSVFITTTFGSTSVRVPIPTLAQLPAWEQTLSAAYIPLTANVYVAIVPTGSPAPAISTYTQYGYEVGLGTTLPVNGVDPGNAAPPNFCSARVTAGQLPTPTAMPDILRSAAGSVVTPPAAPGLSLVNGSGTFGSGTVVLIELTLLNINGETTPGAVATITTTAANQGVQISLAASYGPTVTGVNAYQSEFGGPYCRANAVPYAVGSAPIVTGVTPGGAQPPIANSATLPAGLFPAGRDVYVAMTYTNSVGETPLGPANSIVNTNPNDAVVVTVAEPLGPDNEQLYSITSVGIYEADVATGTAAPPPSAFALVGYYQPAQQPFIVQTATGPNPPTVNGTGPGGSIAADTAGGGINGSQGRRYAALMWMNQNETVSGFTAASVVSCAVDEDGWELGAFLIAIGPANVKARLVAFTVADGTADGPFDWIGDINLLVPSENFVYGMTEAVGNANYTPTAILDNTTTQASFSFDDTYLMQQNNVDDRMQVIAPPPCVRVDYLESVQALALSGVDGLNGGGMISVQTDPESFRGDLGPLAISANGEECYGFTDKFMGIILAVRSASGYAIEPTTGGASGWNAKRRWGGEGPSQGIGACGPKAWAACSKFVMLVNEKGIYKYEGGETDLMAKEVPRQWAKVNWSCKRLIECYIDENTKQVLVSVPMGGSTVPNMVIAISYLEGWLDPIHFFGYMQHEVTQEAARRYSFQDIQANTIRRVKRTLPPGPAYVNGPDWNTMPDSSFTVSQLFFGSSGGDGGLSCRTPGIYNDNGTGIDCVYRTVSAGLMQAVCKPEGFNLNANGQGILSAAFWKGRDSATGQGGSKLAIKCRDIPLTPDMSEGITRKVPPKMGEYWSVEFRNNKVKDSWFSLKMMTVYLIPVTPGRGEKDR
jgi:hypothetical protein